MTKDNQPQPTVWPALRYDNARTAIRTIVDVFGFTESFVVPGDDGADVVHAELRWPEGGGMMLGSTAYQDGTHAEMKPGVGAVYVVTDDPDAVYRRVTARPELELALDLHETDYGSRTFTVRDGEGNLWTFGTYRGA